MDANKVNAIASIVGAIALIGILGVEVKELRETRDARASEAAAVTAQAATLDAIRARVERATAATWVDSTQIKNSCYADNESVACTFTNASSEPLTTCLFGRLTQKKASGVSLRSLTMCTGHVGPRETKRVTAPWVGGFAKDICSSTDRWGNSSLDWQACEFITEPVAQASLENPGEAPK